MERVIVIGGSRVGVRVALSVSNSVVIESDIAKVHILKERFPELEIIHGSGDDAETLVRCGIENAKSVIIATDDDDINYKCALTALEFNPHKLIVKVENIEKTKKFHEIGILNVINPQQIIADEIMDIIYPREESTIEFVISAHSALIGKKIKDVPLPKDCIIASILRGHHLRKPHPEFVFQKGDVVTVVFLGELDEQTCDIITGGEPAMLPFKQIICPLPVQNTVAINECCVLNDLTGIPLRFICESADVKRPLENINCKISIQKSLEKYLKLSVSKYKDCLVVLPHQKLRFGKYNFSWKLVEYILRNSQTSILIPRVGDKYNKILLLIDGSEGSEKCANIALSIAKSANSIIFAVIVPDMTAQISPEEILVHTKRIGKIYGVHVLDEFVEGNPTIEFLAKCRSSEFDLVLLNWYCKTLEKYILFRIIRSLRKSVFVVK